MAESLPTRRALYKKTTDPDNAWVEAVDGEFQAEPNVEYQICCVGPSAITTKTFSASLPWWLSGSIDPSSVVAAYNARNAVSLADSYVNLANPGAFDLTTTAAPSLTTSGWLFDGASHLDTGINLVAGSSVIVKFSDGTERTDAGSFAACGARGTGGYRMFIFPTAAGNRSYAADKVAALVAPRVSDGVMAISNGVGYFNGVAEATVDNLSAGIDQTLHVGANNDFGVLLNYFVGVIESVAVYNAALTDAQVLAVTEAM